MHARGGRTHIVIGDASTHSPDAVDFRKIQLAGAHADAFIVCHNFHPRVHVHRPDLGMLAAVNERTYMLSLGLDTLDWHIAKSRHIYTAWLVAVLDSHLHVGLRHAGHRHVLFLYDEVLLQAFRTRQAEFCMLSVTNTPCMNAGTWLAVAEETILVMVHRRSQKPESCPRAHIRPMHSQCRDQYAHVDMPEDSVYAIKFCVPCVFRPYTLFVTLKMI